MEFRPFPIRDGLVLAVVGLVLPIAGVAYLTEGPYLSEMNRRLCVGGIFALLVVEIILVRRVQANASFPARAAMSVAILLGVCSAILALLTPVI